MLRFLFLCLTIGLFHIHLPAQDSNKVDLVRIESELLFYADVMVNAFESTSRQRAATEFDNLFEDYLASGQAFQKEASFYKFISILDSPDSKFKLISWLKRIDDDVSDYSGYIFYNDGEYIKFNRSERLTKELAYSSCTNNSWYGCLYYKIMKSDKDYLVFGKDFNGKYDNQKIVDLISLDGKRVVFGKPVFEDKEEPDTYLNRIVLRFSSDASVNLNYNPKMEMIVHDHLAPRMGLQPGQGPTNIPDGTYEGYQYKKGKWRYKKKLFNHVYETAPRPKPVFNNTDEDNKETKN